MAEGTTPEDEETRAIGAIRRLVEATTGKPMSEEEARTLFLQTKERLAGAMAQANVERP